MSKNNGTKQAPAAEQAPAADPLTTLRNRLDAYGAKLDAQQLALENLVERLGVVVEHLKADPEKPTPEGVNESMLNRTLLAVCILAEFAPAKQVAKIEALLSGNGGQKTTLAETMAALRASLES